MKYPEKNKTKQKTNSNNKHEPINKLTEKQKNRIKKKLTISKLFSQAYFTHIYDLLREKGPTAIKRRFKTQVNAFSIFNIYKLNAFQRI